MCGGSGGSGRKSGGGGGSTNGDAGQPGEVYRAAQMLDNLRSGKLSLKDAEFAADALLTASMKSRNFDETRKLNKKYTAAMDAIDAYKAERGTLRPTREKTNQEIYKERYGKRDRGLAKKIFGNRPVGSRY